MMRIINRSTDKTEMRFKCYHIIALVASSVMMGCFCRIPYVDSSDIVKTDSMHSHMVTKSTALLFLHPRGPHAIMATVKSEAPAILREDRIYVTNHNIKYPVKLSAFNGVRFKRQKAVTIDSVTDLHLRMRRIEFNEDDTLKLVMQDFPKIADSLVMTVFVKGMPDHWVERSSMSRFDRFEVPWEEIKDKVKQRQ